MKSIYYVGAGVSTIFSVIQLLEQGYDGSKIHIIDAGQDIDNRPEKEYMLGFGGAGFKSDGKIVYSTTQGGELTKYVGEEKTQELLSTLKYYVKKFHPDVTKIVSSGINEIPKWIKNSPFELKVNECEHIGTDYLRLWSINVLQYFINNRVNFYWDTMVTDVDFNKKEIHSKCRTFNYDTLVIAVGKSGMSLVKHITEKYSLPTSPKAAQIGVRFESEYKYFKKIVDLFYDFKLTKKYGNITARTFCCNSLAAYVVGEKNYGMCTYNGHAFKGQEKYNGLTNFGIILEIPGIEDPLEFTKILVEACNTNGVGRYYTPTIRKPLTLGASERTSDVYFKVLYGDYADVIFDFIENLNTMFGFEDDYVFYFPEVKYLTNEIKVNCNNLSLANYNDVHVIGDALSSRGIAIAACHGILVAEESK